jgi:hypothetical protein
MKKIFSLLAFLAATSIILSSCKGSVSNAGPKEVLAAFFEKIAKKDIDGAAKLATKDSKSALDMMKKGLEMAEKMKTNNETAEKDPADEFKDIEIGEAKINGDVAMVPFRNKKKDQEIEFPVKKEDGEWKVDFTMANLMKIGMDQRNKTSMGNESGDDMDNLDMKDTADIRKGLQMADSVLKTIDPEKLKEMQKNLEKLKQ